MTEPSRGLLCDYELQPSRRIVCSSTYRPGQRARAPPVVVYSWTQHCHLPSDAASWWTQLVTNTDLAALSHLVITLYHDMLQLPGRVMSSQHHQSVSRNVAIVIGVTDDKNIFKWLGAGHLRCEVSRENREGM